MMTKEYQVDGMACAHCEKRVTQALLSIEGVSECSASAEKGTVFCTYDESKTNETVIKEQIEEAGYDVKGAVALTIEKS